MPRPAKSKPGRKPTGRLRQQVSVTLGPAALAILERLRTTPGGRLSTTTVIEHLILSAKELRP